ncbi:MAG: hypothetical protein A6D92_02430 [Symbiobacterium thermophilum]|uniref:Uncharacterized protein n=1 Tax=Symbiobacterium thermophilum TaxID=2734 RepID=A0A1Y2T9X0_SYMTR|nr:MAG: hypothetical protein A6D92_02430 [Symbiobacterium thermophilum]
MRIAGPLSVVLHRLPGRIFVLFLAAVLVAIAGFGRLIAGRSCSGGAVIGLRSLLAFLLLHDGLGGNPAVRSRIGQLAAGSVSTRICRVRGRSGATIHAVPGRNGLVA